MRVQTLLLPPRLNFGIAARRVRMRSRGTLDRLVVRVLRHQFAPERLGEDGGLQAVNQGTRDLFSGQAVTPNELV